VPPHYLDYRGPLLNSEGKGGERKGVREGRCKKEAKEGGKDKEPPILNLWLWL